MDAVVPEKAAQNLFQRPSLAVAAVEHPVFQEIGLPLQPREPALPADGDIALVIRIDADLPEIVRPGS